jgi:hypothetical protein
MFAISDQDISGEAALKNLIREAVALNVKKGAK